MYLLPKPLAVELPITGNGKNKQKRSLNLDIKLNRLDIVFVETNTRCSAIVGLVFESMKKVLLIARQIAKKSKPNSFLDV